MRESPTTYLIGDVHALPLSASLVTIASHPRPLESLFSMPKTSDHQASADRVRFRAGTEVDILDLAFHFQPLAPLKKFGPPACLALGSLRPPIVSVRRNFGSWAIGYSTSDSDMSDAMAVVHLLKPLTSHRPALIGKQPLGIHSLSGGTAQTRQGVRRRNRPSGHRTANWRCWGADKRRDSAVTTA